MQHAIWPLLLIIGSNLVYQNCARCSARGANAFVSLTVLYAISTVASLVLWLLVGRNEGGFVESVRSFNWANYLMGIAIIGLEGGFIYLYRAGWSVSVGPVLTYTAVAIGLLFIGAIFYGEHVTARQVLGTLLCLAGIALVSIK